MSSKKYIATLIAISGFLTAFADTDNLTGAWKGPKDLMVNLCIDNDKQLYVGYCGILRTYGWVDFSTSLTPDSLIIKSADIGSPFEGRFKIESDNRLVGKLEMGSHGDDWYFNGNAELVKEKPVMPKNLNPKLEGIILPSDYGVLARDRNIAWEALSILTPKSYGYAEKNMVEKLLNAKTYPITPEDMIGFHRVRSIQIDARDGIFSYPYFNCRFKKADGGKVGAD